MRVRKLSEKRPWPFLVSASILKPLFLATTTHTWSGGENIPETGGCVIVVNHVSHLDPLTMAHFVYDHGRIPHYLAKSGLFTNKALARFLTAAGQIPVERLSRNAIGAYDAAVRAVQRGECVVVYPEGTLTRDPDLWPMRGKSGAARIALATGCPVIPVGQWGVHQILPPYSKRPHLFPRHHLSLKAGPPVPLDDLVGQQASVEAVGRATTRIMAAVTALVAELRDEAPPAELFDPRRSGIVEMGNPHGQERKHPE
jgi:1-acyl-sn-glycerol-3-phosphate acyltransferase